MNKIPTNKTQFWKWFKKQPPMFKRLILGDAVVGKDVKTAEDVRLAVEEKLSLADE